MLNVDARLAGVPVPREGADDSNLHWLICTTVAGGKPLK
jgi:hypothetical protein